MIYLSQRDSRWATWLLGISKLTVGRFGCTTTAISMLSDYFGGFVAPKDLAKDENLYTKDGLIIWGKLDLPTMKFVKRLRYRNDFEIKRSLSGLDTGVILEVNYGQHWVVAVRKTWWKNDYLIIDPWTGKTGTAIGDYKNVTGSAHFKRR